MTRIKWRPVSILVLTTCIGVTGSAVAQDMSFGESEFQARCAACHGPLGKGDGPVAILMKRTPSDLTQLAADNSGHFPFSEVYQAIDGRREIAGHGTRDMPVWGDYFYERALPATRHPGIDAQEMVQARILSLVYYLQTVQGR